MEELTKNFENLSTEEIQKSFNLSLKMRNAEHLKTLISKGADANQSDQNGLNPLQMLLNDPENFSTEMIELLIPHSNLDLKNKDGKTALMIACENKKINPEIIKLLIDSKSEIDLQDNFRKSPLHFYANAQSQKNPKILQFFFESKANLNAQDKSGVISIFSFLKATITHRIIR